MIVIEKSKRTLTLYASNGSEQRKFQIHLGSSPEGAKRSEGDGKTPEGEYRIVSVNPKSKFRFAFGLSYPNRADAKLALREKRISVFTALVIGLADVLGIRPPWQTKLGGFIMLHGEHPEGKTGDWTAGCIALDNKDIDALSKLVKKGERVRILP